MNLKQRILNVKSFFIAYAIGTILCAIFGYIWVFHPEILAFIEDFFIKIGFPVRIDIIQYFFCAIPVIFAGFFHGYRKAHTSEEVSRRTKIDSGLYYLQLFALVGFIYGPCIWDNIIIIYRVLGPEHLNLAAQMEVQFIFIFFLTISLYRFFTIIYVITGTYLILYIRNRSHILWVYLFCIYIYSSLAIGFVFGLDLYPTSFLSEAILTYLLVALLLFIIIFVLYILIKRYKDRSFE